MFYRHGISHPVGLEWKFITDEPKNMSIFKSTETLESFYVFLFGGGKQKVGKSKWQCISYLRWTSGLYHPLPNCADGIRYGRLNM